MNTPKNLIKVNVNGKSVMKNNSTAGPLVYLVTHRSGLNLEKATQKEIKTKEKWRIRDIVEHPVDPGWEIGRYCLCHRSIRNSKKTDPENNSEIYFIDIVHQRHNQHVIRSMFKISDKKPQNQKFGRKIIFDGYYFAPKDPSKILYVQGNIS